MGTPAFPNLGKHCSVADCKQIDFLPFTCDCCQQVFCLEHRSYRQHKCPDADNQGISVVVCPLCAKAVRLVPDEDPHITWETHVNTVCDPTNYEKATNKRKCPVVGCRQILALSNTVKCKDCAEDHCLTHRFGPDHKCPGPRKSNSGFPFMGFFKHSRREDPSPNRAPIPAQPSSTRGRFADSAGRGVGKLSGEFNQASQLGQSSRSRSRSESEPWGMEVCPQCNACFSSITALVEHVEEVHERGSNCASARDVTIDVCPRCSRGFRDPVALVEHVERDHRSSSKA